MAGDLFPAYVEINYHSQYAPHTMTIPTKNWNPGSPYGTFDTWNGSTIAADTMIEALLTLMAPFFSSAVHFDNWTVFTKTAVGAPAIPRTSKVNSTVGTNSTPGNTKAVQATWTAKTDVGSLAKIVMLDMANNNSFEKVTFATVGADGSNFLNEWFNDTNGWSARVDGKPFFFLQIAYTLNEKLRREYHEN